MTTSKVVTPTNPKRVWFMVLAFVVAVGVMYLSGWRGSVLLYVAPVLTFVVGLLTVFMPDYVDRRLFALVAVVTAVVATVSFQPWLLPAVVTALIYVLPDALELVF